MKHRNLSLFAKMSAGTLVFASFLLGAGCASTNKTMNTQADGTPHSGTSATERFDSAAVSNQAALEVKASHFVEIEFKPGSSELSTASRTAIKNTLAEASKAGSIDEVKILAWSDEEYPSKQQGALPAPAKRLADQRSDKVSDYVNSLKYKVDVDRYNMAERPNVLQRWMKTPDARLKNAMLRAGLPTNTDDRQYPSKASKAVILVTVD